MKPETVLEIKNLIKDLVDVSQKSYDLYGCKDLSANEKRQFEYLSDRLFKEWKKIYDKYETEIIKSVQTYADAPDTTLGTRDRERAWIARDIYFSNKRSEPKKVI